MLWMQRDAPQLVRDALRKATKDIEVRADVPERWTPASPPIVTVVSDGTPYSSEGWCIENVRITIHGRDAPTCRRIAEAIDAWLSTPMTRIAIQARITPGAGLICIKNSRLGGWIASVTVEVATKRKATENGSNTAKS